MGFISKHRPRRRPVRTRETSRRGQMEQRAKQAKVYVARDARGRVVGAR